MTPHTNCHEEDTASLDEALETFVADLMFYREQLAAIADKLTVIRQRQRVIHQRLVDQSQRIQDHRISAPRIHDR